MVTRNTAKLIQLAYADALFVVGKLDFDPETRGSSEKRLAQLVTEIEQRISIATNSSARVSECESGLASITLVVVNRANGSVDRMRARIEALRKSSLPEQIDNCLNVVVGRLDEIDRAILDAQKQHKHSALIRAMGEEPARELAFAHTVVGACEHSMRAARSWLGSRREWFVTLAGGLVIGLIVIPLTVWLTPLFSPSPQQPLATNAVTIRQSPPASNERRQAPGLRQEKAIQRQQTDIPRKK